jgi:dephospho-CoA kinase
LVANHFEQWCNQQNTHYVIKEAAILFESEAYKQCDFTITVIAAFDSRMQSVMQRDNITQEKFMSIVNQQISDDEKKQRADFVIYNDDEHSLISQVLAIHQQLLEKK